MKTKGIIRKIVVGNEYRKDSMHYRVKGEVGAGQAVIERIVHVAPKVYQVWVIKDGERLIWKQLENLPVHVEFDLDFSENHD